MADEIKVDYDRLRQVAARFSARASATQQTHQRVQRGMTHLQAAWVGRGSQVFFAEMSSEVLPGLQRLADALRRAQAVTLQISQIFQAAEEDAARPFRTPATLSPESPASGPLRPFIDVLKGITGAADTVWDVLPIPASILLALGLSAGATYPGQVLVRAPQLLRDLGISGRSLRELAGVSGHLSHIKAANIATHVGKIAKSMILVDALISAGKGVVAVADVWERHSTEYAGYDLSRTISARTVDAGMALLPVGAEFAGGVGGVLAGAKVGMLAGGALGSVVPGLGTAVGAAAGGIVGGALGGFTGDWLGGKVGEGAATWIQEQVGRNQMIDFVDQKIALPVIGAVDAAAKAVWLWFEPVPQPQTGGRSSW